MSNTCSSALFGGYWEFAYFDGASFKPSGHSLHNIWSIDFFQEEYEIRQALMLSVLSSDDITLTRSVVKHGGKVKILHTFSFPPGERRKVSKRKAEFDMFTPNQAFTLAWWERRPSHLHHTVTVNDHDTCPIEFIKLMPREMIVKIRETSLDSAVVQMKMFHESLKK